MGIQVSLASVELLVLREQAVSTAHQVTAALVDSQVQVASLVHLVIQVLQASVELQASPEQAATVELLDSVAQVVIAAFLEQVATRVSLALVELLG